MESYNDVNVPRNSPHIVNLLIILFTGIATATKVQQQTKFLSELLIRHVGVGIETLPAG